MKEVSKLTDIKKITDKVMEVLKKEGFLEHLDLLQQDTLEEDVYELLEEWKKVTKKE